MALQLASPDFQNGATIPQTFMAQRCGGNNRAPRLHWSGAPAGTKSFALVVHDPDAPMPGGFYHWAVYDLPPTVDAIGGAAAPGARTGVASTGTAAYHGPCPPHGPAHHYVFTLYALDVAHLGGSAPLTAQEVERRAAEHTLAKATLIGMAGT